ncbi:hypothetical protein [Pseudomonas sp. CLCA07]
MTTSKTNQIIDTKFKLDGRMQLGAGGRIEIDSTDLEFNLKFDNEITIAYYQNKGRPSEKYLSFTFSADITTGEYSITKDGPFRAASFKEVLNTKLDIDSRELYEAIDGKLHFALFKNDISGFHCRVSAINISMKSTLTGEILGFASGSFTSNLTYSTAN